MVFLLLLSGFALTYGIDCDSSYIDFKGICVNSTCTSIYYPRIKTASGKPVLSLYGSYVFNSGELLVSVSFDDQKDDKTMNYDNQYSCIKHKLYIYDSSWLNQRIDNSNISSSYSSGLTKWTWAVPYADFNRTFSLDTSQTGKLIYTAYYAFEFLVETLSQSLNKYTFSFTIDSSVVNNITNITYGETQEVVSVGCKDGGSCTMKLESTLNMCTDQTCGKSISEGQLYFGENYYLIQQISTPGYQNFYLNLQEVRISGDGLDKVTQPISVIQRQGKLILQLTVEFVYYNVTITVSSFATDAIPDNRRRLQAGSAEAIKKLDFPGCILKNRTSTVCRCSEIAESNLTLPEICKVYEYLILINILFIIMVL